MFNPHEVEILDDSDEEEELTELTWSTEPEVDHDCDRLVLTVGNLTSKSVECAANTKNITQTSWGNLRDKLTQREVIFKTRISLRINVQNGVRIRS